MRRVSEASSGSLLRSTIDVASSLLIYSTVTGSAAAMTSQRPQKAAKARVRKATLELGKLGKQYSKESVK